MVYKHGEYTLNTMKINWKGTPGKPRTIYFFAKGKTEKGTPCDLPDGYVVGVNSRTGLPYLKKK